MDGANLSLTFNHSGARATPLVTDHNSPVSRVVSSICGLYRRGNSDPRRKAQLKGTFLTLFLLPLRYRRVVGRPQRLPRGTHASDAVWCPLISPHEPG